MPTATELVHVKILFHIFCKRATLSFKNPAGKHPGCEFWVFNVETSRRFFCQTHSRGLVNGSVSEHYGRLEHTDPIPLCLFGGIPAHPGSPIRPADHQVTYRTRTGYEPEPELEPGPGPRIRTRDSTITRTKTRTTTSISIVSSVWPVRTHSHTNTHTHTHTPRLLTIAAN